MKFFRILCVLVGFCGAALCLSLNCKKICRKIYDPYCLTYEDGTTATFANNCRLEIEICLNGLNSKGDPLTAAKGPCEEEYNDYNVDTLLGLEIE